MLGRRLKVCFLDAELSVTRCEMIDTCMSRVMPAVELICFYPLKLYRHSLLVRIGMLESCLNIFDCVLRIDFCDASYACHTRSERLSSPIFTYENSTDTHFRSEYEWLSLVKGFRLRGANNFYDAMQNYQLLHVTRDVTI